MKRIFPFMLLVMLIAACNSADTKTEPAAREVKQYTIEQFYKSTNAGGRRFFFG
jgi:hypothetical protein